MAGKKSGKAGIEEWAEALAGPIAASHGVSIYDVEYVREGSEYFLNIYIDKESGVTIDDCESVSRELSDALDAGDRIRDAYTLIVSSPGLGRTLTKDRHLQNSLGEKVEIGLFKKMPELGGKQLEGILTDFDKETVTILYTPAAEQGTKGGKKKVQEPAEPVPVTIARKEISVIRLAFDF